MTTVVNNSTFSVAVNHVIEEYNANIGFLTRTYQNIESAKGRWDVRRVEYSQGRLPATSDELDKTLNAELGVYIDFVSATEKSQNLFALFRTTIGYCTKPNIQSFDYEKLEKLGYPIAAAKEGERLLPIIYSKLEILSARVETIKDHMVSRLPVAAKNLNSVFKVVAATKGEDTWKDTGTNLLSNAYLDKALAKRASVTAEETQKKEITAATKTSSLTTTNPDKEVDALQNIFLTLDKLSQEDTLALQQSTKAVTPTQPLEKVLPPEPFPAIVSVPVAKAPLVSTTLAGSARNSVEALVDGGKKKDGRNTKS